jgi:hypothetical protein
MTNTTVLRILLASIKYLGNCPCPRCLVEKAQICELGTKWDDNRRIKQARVENAQRQRKVKKAREFMFHRGDGPTSTRVEAVLGAESLVPTRVSSVSELLSVGLTPTPCI